MKIIDIIKQSAELLGLVQEKELLNTATVENEMDVLKNEEISRLLNLSQYTLQELCTNYVPVYTYQEIETTNKQFALARLDNFLKVLEITKNEKLVDYKIVGRHLSFEEDGKYLVKYTSFPDVNSLFDEIDFLSNFSPDVIVMGLCAFYSLTKGMFEEYNTFHESYLEKAQGIKELKIFEMPMRRWE